VCRRFRSDVHESRWPADGKLLALCPTMIDVDGMSEKNTQLALALAKCQVMIERP
jgi:hypothetical protein